jgi:hypothetical protein
MKPDVPALASHSKPSVTPPNRNTIDGAPLDTVLAMRGAVVEGVYRAAIGRKGCSEARLSEEKWG